MTSVDIVMFLVAEAVIVVGAVFTSYLKTKVQLAQLEVHVSALQADGGKRDKKLEGISRHLSALTGKITTCPHLSEHRDAPGN